MGSGHKRSYELMMSSSKDGITKITNDEGEHIIVPIIEEVICEALRLKKHNTTKITYIHTYTHIHHKQAHASELPYCL